MTSVSTSFHLGPEDRMFSGAVNIQATEGSSERVAGFQLIIGGNALYLFVPVERAGEMADLLHRLAYGFNDVARVVDAERATAARAEEEQAFREADARSAIAGVLVARADEVGA